MACLAVGGNFIAVCSRNQILVLTQSGEICLKYTYQQDNHEEAEDRSPKNGCASKDNCYIVDSNFSQSWRQFAICTSDKSLLIWESISWTIKLKREIPRIPMKVVFSKDDDYAIIADKTGDVYRVSLLDDTIEHVLGHLSVILEMKLIKDGNKLITADIDGKVRVSSYPNCYNIEEFLMGHSSFVSCMALDSSGEYLITVGGDGNLILWNITNGCKCDVMQLKEKNNATPRSVCIDEHNRIFVSLDGEKILLQYEIRGDRLWKMGSISLRTIPLDMKCCGSDILALQNSKEQIVITYDTREREEVKIDKIVTKKIFIESIEKANFLKEPLTLQPWNCQAWADEKLHT